MDDYVDNLIGIVTHARPFEYHKLLDIDDTGSKELAGLAVAVNPALRAEIWDELDDEMRGYVLHFEDWCTTEESTHRMVNTVCHSVTQWWYRQEAQEIVDALIASIREEEQYGDT